MRVSPLLLCAVMLAIPGAHAGPVVDQSDPAYQRTMDNLAAANDAMRTAIEHLRRAERTNPLPGWRLDALRGSQQRLRRNLSNYLTPRQRRHEYHRLPPDGAYFRPEATEDHQ